MLITHGLLPDTLQCVSNFCILMVNVFYPLVCQVRYPPRDAADALGFCTSCQPTKISRAHDEHFLSFYGG